MEKNRSKLAGIFAAIAAISPDFFPAASVDMEYHRPVKQKKDPSILEKAETKRARKAAKRKADWEKSQK